ncbi:MAG TPA: permease-like cell division protein FtsX [Bacilli bacterium]|nr:permease-like cell division protein FtsX [Bacilli bacterium]
MKLRTIGRHLREGLFSLKRNGWMTFASLSAVTVTLLLLGVFLLLAFNVQQFSKQIESQVEMNVMVKTGASRAESLELERQIKALPGVGSVVFVSKEEGFDQMKEKFKGYEDMLAGIEEENPLPDKFIVKAQDPLKTKALSTQIAQFPIVDKVNFGEETVDQLFTATKFVRNAGAVFVFGLIFTALFLISNTIKVTIFARRREIEIMRLVGATNWFIRWPFLVEGFLIGVLGAIVPIGVLGFAYNYLVDKYPSLLVFHLAPFDPLVFMVGGTLIGIGALIGMAGSVMSISRFLRI